MAEITGNAFGRAMCVALGIDASIVSAIDIKAPAQRPVSVEVTVSPMLTDEQLCAIGDALIADKHNVQIVLKRGA